MSRYYLEDQILATRKKVSIGIDVSKESWQPLNLSLALGTGKRIGLMDLFDEVRPALF